MSPSNTDPNFENFRRQRKQQQARYATGQRPETALREIQEYESKQMHEARLTREVHEFLAAATKQAATIVERVTVEAETEAAGRLQAEMHEFLAETVRRATTFLMQVQTHRGRGGLADLEPHLSNLVGPLLDSFRVEGTAQLRDKHIGQDPFAPPAAQRPPAPGTAAAKPAPAAAGEPAPPAVGSRAWLEKLCADGTTLKKTLKALVTAGVLDPEEARRIYCEHAPQE